MVRRIYPWKIGIFLVFALLYCLLFEEEMIVVFPKAVSHAKNKKGMNKTNISCGMDVIIFYHSSTRRTFLDEGGLLSITKNLPDTHRIFIVTNITTYPLAEYNLSRLMRSVPREYRHNKYGCLKQLILFDEDKFFRKVSDSLYPGVLIMMWMYFAYDVIADLSDNVMFLDADCVFMRPLPLLTNNGDVISYYFDVASSGSELLTAPWNLRAEGFNTLEWANVLSEGPSYFAYNNFVASKMSSEQLSWVNVNVTELAKLAPGVLRNGFSTELAKGFSTLSQKDWKRIGLVPYCAVGTPKNVPSSLTFRSWITHFWVAQKEVLLSMVQDVSALWNVTRIDHAMFRADHFGRYVTKKRTKGLGRFGEHIAYLHYLKKQFPHRFHPREIEMILTFPNCDETTIEACKRMLSSNVTMIACHEHRLKDARPDIVQLCNGTTGNRHKKLNKFVILGNQEHPKLLSREGSCKHI